METISTMLWFDGKAEEAAKFYVSIFPNSKLGRVARYGEAASKSSGQPVGSVMTVDFVLDGRSFVALNGGPGIKFNESVSFVVNCDSQAEIDRYWERLTAGGGAEVVCGWLKDRYGVSWQVCPASIWKLIAGPKSDQVMAEVVKMKKLDMAILERAGA